MPLSKAQLVLRRLQPGAGGEFWSWGAEITPWIAPPNPSPAHGAAAALPGTRAPTHLPHTPRERSRHSSPTPLDPALPPWILRRGPPAHDHDSDGDFDDSAAAAAMPAT